MKICPTKIIKLIVPFIALFLTISCNKDSDLLAEYVVGENGGLAENVIDLENGTIITSEDKLISINLLRDNRSGTERKGAVVKKVSQPVNGKTEIKTDSVIVYIPNEDFNGKDTINYVVEETAPDNIAVEKENTVVIEVSPILDAVHDTVQTSSDKKVSVDVLKNDTFTNKDKVTVSKTTAPSKGKVAINKDNSLTYTPTSNASGEDTFTYTAQVVNADKSVSTDEGKVTVNISSSDRATSLTGDNIFYVTTTGKRSNSGTTEAEAWDIQYAFKTAKAGDIVYVKAGNYGNKELVMGNSGTADKSIKFIGYTNAPGDLVSNVGSTFKYGDDLDPNKMPLLTGTLGKTAIVVQKDYIEVENIQLTKYSTAITSKGRHVVYRNIIATQLGNQSNFNAYNGWGIMVFGDNSLLENCFVLNAGAEAIKLSGSNNSRVNYCEVRADNPGNPTDYYFLLTGGTTKTIIENSYAERKEGLNHNGHGFDMKNRAEYNTFKNCAVSGTSFELNFSGVRYNTIEDCIIYGRGTKPTFWGSRMAIFNGANNNLIKGMLIQNTWAAIYWGDYDDGYKDPEGDLDEVSCGYDNTFENITVRNTDRILNVGGGTSYNAKAERNTFINCDFSDFSAVAFTYYITKDITFKNCKFNNAESLIKEAGGSYAPYSKSDFRYESCSWSNIKFIAP